MAIPESQLRECLGAVGAFLQKRRPPPELREEVDLWADISGSEVVIVEIRPAYNDKKRRVDRPIAKAKWIGTKGAWRLFWMRADMK